MVRGGARGRPAAQARFVRQRAKIGGTVVTQAHRVVRDHLLSASLAVTLAVGCSEGTGPHPALVWISVSASADHTCGVTTSGAAYCWGHNGYGAFGNGVSSDNSAVPVAVSGGLTFRFLRAGYGYTPYGTGYTCGLTSTGRAYCWGANDYGRLGDGSFTGHLTPVPVTGGLTYAGLTAFAFHTCAVTTSGGAYCWGENSAIDTSGAASITTPVAVTGGLTFASVTVGANHTCGLTTDGIAYCWGLDLGDSSTTYRLVPTAVVGGLRFTSLTAGYAHTCGVTPSGAAYCWGDNGSGQLGDGTTASRSMPVAVAGGLTFASLSSGYFHTCGLTGRGAAYCWGSNSWGQFGDGDTTTSLTPVAVAAGLTFASVSAGGAHTCGVTPGGAAYCWGANNLGTLGDGTTIQRLRPARVTNP